MGAEESVFIVLLPPQEDKYNANKAKTKISETDFLLLINIKSPKLIYYLNIILL